MTTLNLIKCSPSEAIDICLALARMPVATRPAIMLHGKPGTAKSSVARAVSRTLFGKKPLIKNIGQMQPVDMRGLPFTSEDKTTTVWLRPGWFPVDPDARGVLLFDEFMSGDRDTMASCYSILLDRELDGHTMSPGYVVIATGNDVSDGAIANEIGTALADRVVHLLLHIDDVSFVEYHTPRGLHPAVLSTIVQMPALLNNHTEVLEKDLLVGTTARAWERAGTILKEFEAAGTDERLISVAMSGIVGDAAARHLMLTVKESFDCAAPRTILGAARHEIEGLLPTKPRAALALAFTLPALAEGVEQLAKICLVMDILGTKLAKAEVDREIRLNGREVASYGLERTLMRAEALKLSDELLTATHLPGHAEMMKAFEAKSERYKLLRGMAA